MDFYDKKLLANTILDIAERSISKGDIDTAKSCLEAADKIVDNMKTDLVIDMLISANSKNEG